MSIILFINQVLSINMGGTCFASTLCWSDKCRFRFQPRVRYCCTLSWWSAAGRSFSWWTIAPTVPRYTSDNSENGIRQHLSRPPAPLPAMGWKRDYVATDWCMYWSTAHIPLFLPSRGANHVTLRIGGLWNVKDLVVVIIGQHPFFFIRRLSFFIRIRFELFWHTRFFAVIIGL